MVCLRTAFAVIAPISRDGELGAVMEIAIVDVVAATCAEPTLSGYRSDVLHGPDATCTVTSVFATASSTAKTHACCTSSPPSALDVVGSLSDTLTLSSFCAFDLRKNS